MPETPAPPTSQTPPPAQQPPAATTPPAKSETPPATTQPDKEARFAALEKREAAFQQQVAMERAKLKAEKELVEKEKGDPDYQRFKEWRGGKAKANAMDVLKLHGLTYEDVALAQLNGGRATPEQAVEALRAEIADKEKKAEDARAAAKAEEDKRKQAEAQRLEEDFTEEVQEACKEAGDAAELVTMYEAWDLVKNAIRHHHAQTGKLMDYKTAIEKTEDFLAKQLLRARGKLDKLTAKEAAEAAAAGGKPKNGTTTLSNDMGAGTPAAKGKPKNREERIQRALEAMEKTKRA